MIKNEVNIFLEKYKYRRIQENIDWQLSGIFRIIDTLNDSINNYIIFEEEFPNIDKEELNSNELQVFGYYNNLAFFNPLFQEKMDLKIDPSSLYFFETSPWRYAYDLWSHTWVVWKFVNEIFNNKEKYSSKEVFSDIYGWYLEFFDYFGEYIFETNENDILPFVSNILWKIENFFEEIKTEEVNNVFNKVNIIKNLWIWLLFYYKFSSTKKLDLIPIIEKWKSYISEYETEFWKIFQDLDENEYSKYEWYSRYNVYWQIWLLLRILNLIIVKKELINNSVEKFIDLYSTTLKELEISLKNEFGIK